MKNCIKHFPCTQFKENGFKPLTLSDSNFLKNFFIRNDVKSCEFNITSLICWNRDYGYEWMMFNDRLIIIDRKNKRMLMPVGETFLPKDLHQLMQQLAASDFQGKIELADEGFILENPDVETYFSVIEEPDFSEYTYSVSKLVELKGPKLQKKKNLISQFKKTHPDYKISPVTQDNLADIWNFTSRILQNNSQVTRSIREEYGAIKTAMKLFKDLDIEGLVIHVDGDIAAFSLFSRLNDSTYDIHFEKSDFTYKGSAQMINFQTALHLQDKCQLVNREQDLGLTGLKQAKMSYDPVEIQKYYTLIPKL